jgi:hypothetical protein
MIDHIMLLAHVKKVCLAPAAEVHTARDVFLLRRVPLTALFVFAQITKNRGKARTGSRLCLYFRCHIAVSAAFA